MGFDSGNNQRVGLDGITSTHPTRFVGATDEYTVCVLFKKPADGGEAYGRLVSNASSGNGNNGWEVCLAYQNANDRRLMGLLDGAGTNVRIEIADAFSNGDVVAAFYHFSGTGNEVIYGDYNRTSLDLLKSTACDNGPFKTGNSKLRIGGCGWTATRDSAAYIYRVLIYDRLLGVPEMSWMSFSNFANRPLRGLTCEWHCRPYDQFPGDTITNDIPDIGGSGCDLTIIEGAPEVIEPITFEV